MPRFSLSRLSCGLLVLSFLAAPTLAAASPAPQTSGLAAGLSSLWSWVLGLWGEEGCYIDPHGGCRAGVSSVPSAQDQVDTGCYIDPHGGCGESTGSAPSVPESETGCYIDPHGGCGS